MTLQDDRARPWFQPVVPTEGRQDRDRTNNSPMTTHFAGDLRAEDMEIVAPRMPEPPSPARVEVTQPYIPAIRDETPEFAKRLNPNSAPWDSAPPDAVTTALPLGDVVREQSAPAGSVAPARSTSPQAPPKRRSLVRRAVRRIIGPDLLRKDPAPKKR